MRIKFELIARWCVFICIPCFAINGSESAKADDDTLNSEYDYIIFSSAQIGTGVNLSSGIKFSIAERIDQPGLVAIIGSSADADSYKSWQNSAQKFNKTTIEGFFVIAGQWRTDTAWLTFGFGPEFVNITTNPKDIFNRRNGTTTGIKFIGDYVKDINHNTFMKFNLVGSSAATRLWSQIYLGFKIKDKLDIGPELWATFEPSYRKTGAGLRIGYNLSSNMTINASIGIARDNKAVLENYISATFVYKYGR